MFSAAPMAITRKLPPDNSSAIVNLRGGCRGPPPTLGSSHANTGPSTSTQNGETDSNQLAGTSKPKKLRLVEFCANNSITEPPCEIITKNNVHATITQTNERSLRRSLVFRPRLRYSMK